MTWGCIYICNGASYFEFVSDKINSEVHQNLLGSHLFPNAKLFARENCKFQQDNVKSVKTRKKNGTLLLILIQIIVEK